MEEHRAGAVTTSPQNTNRKEERMEDLTKKMAAKCIFISGEKNVRQRKYYLCFISLKVCVFFLKGQGVTTLGACFWERENFNTGSISSQCSFGRGCMRKRRSVHLLSCRHEGCVPCIKLAAICRTSKQQRTNPVWPILLAPYSAPHFKPRAICKIPSRIDFKVLA